MEYSLLQALPERAVIVDIAFKREGGRPVAMQVRVSCLPYINL